MTIVIQSVDIDNYCISIEQDKYESCYKVRVNEFIDKAIRYCRVINEHYYPTLAKAKRRFNYLKRRIAQ